MPSLITFLCHPRCHTGALVADCVTHFPSAVIFLTNDVGFPLGDTGFPFHFPSVLFLGWHRHVVGWGVGRNRRVPLESAAGSLLGGLAVRARGREKARLFWPLSGHVCWRRKPPVVTELEAGGTRACHPSDRPRRKSPLGAAVRWVCSRKHPPPPPPPGPGSASPARGGAPSARGAGGEPVGHASTAPAGLVGLLGLIRVPSCGRRKWFAQQPPCILECLWAALATATSRGGRAGWKGDVLPAAPGRVGGPEGALGTRAGHSQRLGGASLSTKPRARAVSVQKEASYCTTNPSSPALRWLCLGTWGHVAPGFSRLNELELRWRGLWPRRPWQEGRKPSPSM